MEKLLDCIEKLKKSNVKKTIKARMKEFKENRKKPINQIFQELCFCILAANYNAEKTIKIQSEIGDQFLTLREKQLAKQLKTFGYRFPSTRAKYIVEARKHKNLLKNMIESSTSQTQKREWLARNIKGIGYKEASHFLRNIGYTNLAILDFHIINILTQYKIIKKPKTLNKKTYQKIEASLKKIAKKTNLNLAELDLYLWCMETGKILK
ncbi:MAG: N-glycosylase/DNA lyase [Candidatus Bathyarchaeales archaeon]